VGDSREPGAPAGLKLRNARRRSGAIAASCRCRSSRHCVLELTGLELKGLDLNDLDPNDLAALPKR